MSKRRRIFNNLGECYIAFSKLQKAQDDVARSLNEFGHSVDTVKAIEMRNAITNLRGQIDIFEERFGALYETSIEEEIPIRFIDLENKTD